MPISNGDIKEINALAQRKFRQKYNKFVVEGDKSVRELLGEKQFPIDRIYALEGWLEAHRSTLVAREIYFEAVNERELKKISGLRTPNAVLAIAHIPDYLTRFDPGRKDRGWQLYLDGLQDPGNMGTILRIADWFGLAQVICGPGCVEVWNPKVIQAAMGAAFRIPTPQASLSDIVALQSNLAIYGAFMDGISVREAEFPERGLLVIGNEGSGISPESAALIQQRIAIPKGKTGQAESLNAAVAAGILCAMVVR